MELEPSRLAIGTAGGTFTRRSKRLLDQMDGKEIRQGEIAILAKIRKEKQLLPLRREQTEGRSMTY